jgi:hypothetical protein
MREKTSHRYKKKLDSLCPKKVQQVCSKVKMMLSFLDYRCIVHRAFILASQTVNQAYYLQVLRSVTEPVRRRQPEMWTARTFHLHHDSHSVVNSNRSRQRIRLLSSHNLSIRLIRHTSKFSIPKIKISLKGKISDGAGHNRNRAVELRAIQQT